MFHLFSALIISCTFLSLCVPYLPLHAENSVSSEPAAASLSPNEQGAKEFIIELGDEAISLLTSKTITEEVRKERFKKLFNEHFSTADIAKFSLGRYWRQATDSEKKEYLDLFDDSVADSYASKFSQYNHEDQFIVSSTRTIKDGGVKVYSIIKTEDSPINVIWLVYKTDTGYKIFDVILEGVSMSVTQRSEYSSIIQRSGGKVGGLIDALRTKQTPA